MTPPPHPLILSLAFRKRSDRLSCDPALDDPPLTAARAALMQGRWLEVRTLLQETGDDWDRRSHRLLTLAAAPAAEAWARDWQLAEPDSSDAAVLLACAATSRADRGKQTWTAARELIDAAVRAAPGDPTPWLALLVLFRRSGTYADCRYAFEELRDRHPDHHHAHHLMTAVTADHDADVYEFASEVAERVPADSPLTQLPVVAHAERYRALVTSGGTAKKEAADGYWTGRRAQSIVRGAFDWWLEWGAEDGHPRRLIDLNFLAYAKFHEGRMAEAAALFQRIGPHVTPAPWSYGGGSPERAFRSTRLTALGMSPES
jgi:hypothetical protein